MSSSRRIPTVTAPVWSAVGVLIVVESSEPIRSSPLEPWMPLTPGRAGIPPCDGVPKSVKAE